jgi:hypothetical protein
LVVVVDQPPCHEAPEPFDQHEAVDDMAEDDMAEDERLEAPTTAAAARARAATGRAVCCGRWIRRCMVDRWWAEPCGTGLSLGKQNRVGCCN